MRRVEHLQRGEALEEGSGEGGHIGQGVRGWSIAGWSFAIGERWSNNSVSDWMRV